MKDAEIEQRIRHAGYDLQWDAAPDGQPGRRVFALRDGKRHTQAFATLLEIGEHLGLVERPVRFIEDSAAIKAAIAKHAEVPRNFTARSSACRAAVFNGLKYVELTSSGGDETAMYELRPDGLRKMSNGNLPAEVVAAFNRSRR